MRPVVQSDLSTSRIALTPINPLPAPPPRLQELGATKALILTGRSLATKTSLISHIESILGSAHGATFYSIGEHAPVSGIHAARAELERVGADVIVTVGGGSPVDAAKAVAYFVHEQGEQKGNDHPDSFVPQIAIPTTLSVAETTMNAGYTSEEGRKIG